MLRILQTRLLGELHRDSYVLVAGTLVAGLLSAGFWVVAARTCHAGSVGIASSAISLAGLASSAGELGVGIGLIRFLPANLSNSPRMVNAALSVVLCTTLVGSVGTVGFVVATGGELAAWFGNTLPVVAFALAAVCASLITVANAVLLSRRRPLLVVSALVISEGTKLALVAAARGCPGETVLVLFSAAGAAAAVVLALAVLLPRALVGFRALRVFSWRPLRPLVLYSATNYAARFFVQTPALVLPLVVLSLLGAEAAGYFVPALLVFRAVTIVPTSVGNVLFAAGSREPAGIAETARSVLTCILGLTALACLGAVLVLPPLLAFLGHGYAEQGRTALVLMSFSALPWAVAYTYLSIERVRGRAPMILTASVMPSVLSTGGAALLASKYGLDGAGIGFFVGQALGAGAVAPPLVSSLRQRGVAVGRTV